MSKSRQYTLPIINRPDFTSYSYVVGRANKGVYGLIESWPNWPFKQCVVYGPAGYGKTHFGRILADFQSANFLLAKDINEDTIGSFGNNQAYVIDEIESAEDFSMLFHFYNSAVTHECFVVYLMEQAPGKTDFLLQDLNSRMRSLMTFEISQPDDDLCKAIIRKIFIDHSILVSDAVVNYLLMHTSRNLADIQRNINLLNQRALEEKRNITIPFLKSILQC